MVAAAGGRIAAAASGAVNHRVGAAPAGSACSSPPARRSLGLAPPLHAVAHPADLHPLCPLFPPSRAAPVPQGIKNVPKRLRVVIQRKRAEDDEDSEEMFSVVSLAEDQNTKKGVVVLEA